MLRNHPDPSSCLYRGRANCENRIKELKYDYGLDRMNEQSFDGTEASSILMTIACNFMSLFKQKERSKCVRCSILRPNELKPTFVFAL
ncbi:MAG: transposase [Tannerella sp.]|nr:transposase [Tannerella sp.]